MGKHLLCARTVAKRTLGKVKMGAKKQVSGAGLRTPRAGAPKNGFTPLAFSSEVKHRIKPSAGALQCT